MNSTVTTALVVLFLQLLTKLRLHYLQMRMQLFLKTDIYVQKP